MNGSKAVIWLPLVDLSRITHSPTYNPVTHNKHPRLGNGKMQCNYQPKLSAICQGWENWLMSLGQSSKRKSLMEERKLIQLYSMQKRQGVLAIFVCQFSSYQSHPHPPALVYSKKPIQIQYISGSCHPQPPPHKKKCSRDL